jgi:hypothetical protein
MKAAAHHGGPLSPDLQVIDGLAYLAYWRDGAIILDVGNGIKEKSEHRNLSPTTGSIMTSWHGSRLACRRTRYISVTKLPVRRR